MSKTVNKLRRVRWGAVWVAIGPVACALLLLVSAARGEEGARKWEFNRDVRPILAGYCLKCHGPDEEARQASLRFDVRESATGEAESGKRAIVPGDVAASELVRRILSEDDSERMPPPAANKRLSPEQKQILSEWISQGAGYQTHWAFTAPVAAPLPEVSHKQWPRNGIDHFVLARLERERLQPSAEADRYTLARRVALDLVGLPPTPEEIDQFVFDNSPTAYEAMVDRLLASPAYGERWARRWLDLARYADTNGYEKDRQRSIWPYRDWVINALNADMPFDQFTIEQLAGDLLPGATVSQRVATGFHRNTMLNEEGGIDPLEFRFHAMVDRVATTATVWLGLTMGCAQCHTHKYDPVPHKDYYQLMAFLNNADEVDLDVPREEIASQRAQIAAQIASAEQDLATKFPPADPWRWHPGSNVTLVAESGTTAELLPDGSLRLPDRQAEQDVYTVTLETDQANVSAIRLRVLADEALPHKGPGLAPNGNFVLTSLSAMSSGLGEGEIPQAVALSEATADFAQDSFPAQGAIDADAKTGWAIHGKDPWNVNRDATFKLASAVNGSGRRQWTIRLEQNYGGRHTLGRFQIQLGEYVEDARPEAERRAANLENRFATWMEEERGVARKWELLRPMEAKSKIPTLSLLDDGSVLASGDMSKRDEYVVRYSNPLPRIMALRLEVLPDERLPKRGPGRVSYEGPFGDFFLSEISAVGRKAGGDAVATKLVDASGSFGSGNSTVTASIDGDPQTGWSINGGQGREHVAVYRCDPPLEASEVLELRLLFERYYAAGLGRFRLWATSEDGATARALPTALEGTLQKPKDQWTADEQAKLRTYYLSVVPELEAARGEIQKLRNSSPAQPTTLVMQERPADDPRKTFMHHRGEYLQPTKEVTAELPSLFAAMGADEPRNRLTFARWLASARNPLVARVTVNRQWAALWGRGIVRTTEDFGYQGEPPTHPELLDWLAMEFMQQGWSMKKLHRLMVTSATYRQASRVSAELIERDPKNVLLARGPRARLDAELIRDAALRASGLLSAKLGGPSVFPPQPPGVTAEGTYGTLKWQESTGEDRYRRGLYTFSKRTAPYAMFLAFDAPSGEACLARREVSNTPLQALTLLNDVVFLEAARALGELALTEQGNDRRLEYVFRRCLNRPPTESERESLLAYLTANQQRLASGELDAAKIMGRDGAPSELAAWTLVARVLLNVDEAITKE